ncbi:MAG: hypothetical protein KAS04_05835 [Candidatus Aenigmarchaeota archaeon]|nr:hypothetical protein [Candidatus Aenigmarchaeota archaeon]
MVMEWERQNDVIAENFKKSEISGSNKKEFHTKSNEFLLFEKNDEIYKERGPGKIPISPINFSSITVVDKSEKTLSNTVKNVRFSDNNKTDIKFTIKFRVVHTGKFYKGLMVDRQKLSLEDMWDDILSKIIYKEVLPHLGEKPSFDFAGNEAREKLIEYMRPIFRNFFGRIGIALMDISTDYELENATEPEKDNHEKGEGQTESYSEMQKELKKPDTDLEKKLKELEEAKRIAEHKFYKKELSEEAFQRMMEDFEEKIIEIEATNKKQKEE